VILVVGAHADPVLGRIVSALEQNAVPLARIDEHNPRAYRIEYDGHHWRVRGDACQGCRPVAVILVRHSIQAATRADRGAWLDLKRALDTMLLATRSRVVNRPAVDTDNYSKPYQARQLAAAGLRVPSTLVTNIPDEVLRFVAAQGGRVLFKGVSDRTTVPQMLTLDHLARIDSVAGCPVQFQEFIEGDDYRVTVVDDSCVVTRGVGGEADCSSAVQKALPGDLLQRCIACTRDAGLVISGIDLRLRHDGTACVFELNPCPAFIHHETDKHPRITGLLVRYLMRHRHEGSDVLV